MHLRRKRSWSSLLAAFASLILGIIVQNWPLVGLGLLLVVAVFANELRLRRRPT